MPRVPKAQDLDLGRHDPVDQRERRTGDRKLPYLIANLTHVTGVRIGRQRFLYGNQMRTGLCAAFGKDGPVVVPEPLDILRGVFEENDFPFLTKMKVGKLSGDFSLSFQGNLIRPALALDRGKE